MNSIKDETESYIRPILNDLKKIGSKLDEVNKGRIYDIQYKIISLIIETEYKIKGLKSSEKSVKRFLEKCSSVSRKEPKIKRSIPFIFYQNLIYNIESDIKLYKHRINILKSFLDSIVWKFCSNVQIKYMSSNQRNTEITGKIGFLHEIVILEELVGKHINKPIVFILSDATNCVTISDIVGLGKNGLRYLIECKMSTRKSDRIIRQKKRVSQLKNFLIKKEMNGEYDSVRSIYEFLGEEPKRKGPLKIKIVEFSEIENEFASMEKVIKEAKIRGSSVLNVNECVTFLAVDLRKVELKDLILKEKKKLDKISKRRLTSETLGLFSKILSPKNLKEKIQKEFPKSDNKEKTFMFDVCQYDSYLRYRKKHYLPFASFPISNEVILDILLDRVLFLVILNIDKLIKELEENGLKAVYIDGPPQFLFVKDSKGRRFAVQDLFFKIGHEVMKIESFIKNVKKTVEMNQNQ